MTRTFYYSGSAAGMLVFIIITLIFPLYMDAKAIISFLKDITVNNSREWFGDNKDRYQYAKASFEDGVAKAIVRLSTFDSSISHISVKDATYRFHRDTRFSSDKSPYKRHLGAYIAAMAKKPCTVGITFIWSRATAFCLLATIGSPPMCLPLVVMR